MKTGAQIFAIFLVIFVSHSVLAADWPPAGASVSAMPYQNYFPTTGAFGITGPNTGGFTMGDALTPEAPIGKCQMADEADEKDPEGDEKQAQEDKNDEQSGQACIENLRTKKEAHAAAETALRNFSFTYSEFGAVDANQQKEFESLTQAEKTAREARKAAQDQCKAAAQARAEQCKQKARDMKEACNRDVGADISAAADEYSKTSQGSAATINASASKLRSDLRDMRRKGVATCKQCKSRNRRTRSNCEKTGEFIKNVKNTDPETDVQEPQGVVKNQERPINDVEAVTLPQMAKSIEDLNGLETQAGQLAASAAMSTSLSPSSVFGNELNSPGFSAPVQEGGMVQTQVPTTPAAGPQQAAAPQAATSPQAAAPQAAQTPMMAPQQPQAPVAQPAAAQPATDAKASSTDAMGDKLKPIVDNSTPNATTQTKTEDQKAHTDTTGGNVAGSLYGGTAQAASASSVTTEVEAPPIPMASSHAVGGVIPATFEKKDAGGAQASGGTGTFVNGGPEPMSANLAGLKKQNGNSLYGGDSGSSGGRRSSMSYIGSSGSGSSSSSSGFKPSRYDDDDRQVAGATSKVDLRQFLPGERMAGGRGPASQAQLGIHGAHVNFFNKVNERYHALQDSLDP